MPASMAQDGKRHALSEGLDLVGVANIERFDGATPGSDKEVFLRATFRRTSTNRLSTPYWKVINRNTVRELTDRRFR